MRRKLLVVATVVVACAVLVLLLVVTRRSAEVKNHISHDGFEQIAKGMARQEVEALLGVPPGDYVTEPVHFVRPVGARLIEDLKMPPAGPETEVTWQGNGGRIVVWFDEQDKVARRVYFPAAWELSFIQRLRFRLGLR